MLLTRRKAVLLVLAGLWPLLVWPNFVRVIAGDERAFDSGPTAFLLVHVALAAVSMGFGVVLVVMGVRAWLRPAGPAPALSPAPDAAKAATRSG